MMPDVEDVEVVVAHSERATLRVGEVFLKVDADQTRTDVEVEAMAVGTDPGSGGSVAAPARARARRRLGDGTRPPREPSTASAVAWAAAGAAARLLHDAPLRIRGAQIAGVRPLPSLGAAGGVPPTGPAAATTRPPSPVRSAVFRPGIGDAGWSLRAGVFCGVPPIRHQRAIAPAPTLIRSRRSAPWLAPQRPGNT
jgi:hypothetical protein